MFHHHVSVRKSGRVAVNGRNHENVTAITITEVEAV
jgi:hypothetical protein